MGTTAQKLARTEQTKSELFAAINATGCPPLTTADTFASYADKIADYLVYPQGTLSITENNQASVPVDTTLYKFVDVNVQPLVYTAAAVGSGRNNITFTGLPNAPALFVVHINGSATFGKNSSAVIACHGFNGACEYQYTGSVSGNTGHIEFGDAYYESTKQANNTYTLYIEVGSSSNAAAVFTSGLSYECEVCYVMAQR